MSHQNTTKHNHYPRFNKTDHVNYTADISAKGVLELHPKEIERAFKFFDTENQNKITAKDLRKRLQILYPQIGVKEIKTLLGEGTFTIETLTAILKSNSLQQFDPFEEAFRVFDPNNTGFVDENVLRTIMTQAGHGPIAMDDMRALIESSDVDKDGKISFEDFKNMIENYRKNLATEDPKPVTQVKK